MRTGPICAAMVAALTAVTAPTARATTPGCDGALAYGLETATSTQVVAFDPRTHATRQLTDTTGVDASRPDWSPSGRLVVYESDTETTGEIRLMAADGSHDHAVTPQGLSGFFGAARFVPHSDRFVFERYDPTTGDDSLWTMRRDGAHPVRLTTSPFPGVGGDTDPEVSPDGRTISFVRMSVPDDQQALFSIGLDGRHLHQLLPYGDDVAVKSDWSPDGRHLVVAINANVGSRPNASANVLILRRDGSHRRQLTHFTGRTIDALVGSFSPDGRWVVYRVETGEETGTLPGGRFGLYVVHPWGGRPHLLGAFDDRPRGTDWGSHGCHR